MKHNINIPGWNGNEILNVIGEYAAAVPENGNILELGALFGRSTYSLGHNKKDSVKLTSIDIWSDILMKNHVAVNYHDGHTGPDELKLMLSKIVPDPDRIPGESFYELWKEYTTGIVNNEGIRSDTGLPNTSFPDFDFIFHDAAHDFRGVYSDLVHWFPKLKHNGVLIIDDYERSHFSGLCDAVDKFVKECDLQTEMVTGRNILLKRKL